MSQFAEIRADFNRRVATSGWSRPEHVDGNWPVPIDRWLARFYKPAHFELAHQRRLANHFLVGADPEFVFMNSGGRVSAEHFEFKAGLAYGADNNGRLVEIRPKPSRWVLEVLTSTWSTLKWMSLLEPATLQYQWRAGAFYADDGLGVTSILGASGQAGSEKVLRSIPSVTICSTRVSGTGPRASSESAMPKVAETPAMGALVISANKHMAMNTGCFRAGSVLRGWPTTV